MLNFARFGQQWRSAWRAAADTIETTFNVTQLNDADEFVGCTAALRATDLIGSSLIASIAEAARKANDGATQFWIATTKEPTAYALTSSRGVVLSPFASPEDADALGECIAKNVTYELPQVNGQADSIEAFARGFSRVHPNATFHHKFTILVYELKALAIPSNVPGALRVATKELDLELLIEWSNAFFKHENESFAGVNAFVTGYLERQALFVWEVNGYPVGFLSSEPFLVGNMTVYRIGPVYTAPEERRKGYASAMTAALSQRLQQLCPTSSCRIMLNADAANPASNKAYQNVDFVLHSESATYTIQHHTT
ncbi:hypothetical protein LEN26_019017 [Aphanomyces euteiches]|nr:hypothetical protein LEN26_019017 [Aphanomyces euteiches]KAH9129760.1 hypothetical protein AeMF1_000180 [Aphanomyces euteiches]KAH9195229.1 hypothetical protein AeNC1_002810 [Aphanomyces euteiches]